MITFVPSVLVCITTIKIQLKTLLVNYLFISNMNTLQQNWTEFTLTFTVYDQAEMCLLYFRENTMVSTGMVPHQICSLS